MKTTLWKLAFASSLFASACSGVGGNAKHSSIDDDDQLSESAFEDEDEDDDQDIALDALPAVVKNAALAAVPGLVLTSAELEFENGREIYSVEGTANGTSYCVEVAPDGTLIGVEDDGAETDDEDED